MRSKTTGAVLLVITCALAMSGAQLSNGAYEQPPVTYYAFVSDAETGLAAPVSPVVSATAKAGGHKVAGSVRQGAHDLTVEGGIAVTPNRKATEGGTWNQESKNGPSLGVEYQVWKGVFTELDYVNTNTRLQNYSINTWTMNRLSLDTGYEVRWGRGRLSPFVKVGGGVMVLLSGHATDNSNVGVDDRLEVLTGVGIRYRLSHHLSGVLEFEERMIRDSDFADHGWKPERNFLSESKVGVAYVFGGRGGR